MPTPLIVKLFKPILKGSLIPWFPQKQYYTGTPVLIFLMIWPSMLCSQELTDIWSGNGTVWTSNICSLSVTTTVSGLQNGATVFFNTGSMGCNMPNTFSSNDVVNHPAIESLLNFGSDGGGILTFTFSRPVTNPVLHIDRLGGAFNTLTNSALLTLVTPDLSLTKLSGNGTHFVVTSNTITRTPDQAITTSATLDCGPPEGGRAAGSVLIEGIVSSVSFKYELNGDGSPSAGDVIDIIWEVYCDFDQDGIDDSVDLDDDNDGILDTTELGGNPALDSDNDGFTDAYDLDSDGDGCFDVIEAGFSDPDADGVLGTLPDTVDSDGLIINEPDGYTTPADNDMNGVYDFQEEILPIIRSQPQDRSYCEGDDVTIAISVENAASIQWQLSTDSGATWADLADDNVHSGVQLQNLTIQNITLERDQYRYRVHFGACSDPMFSEAMKLSVFEPPDAGTDGSITFCPGDGPENLINALGGDPDLTGTWYPALSQNNGIFTPGLDTPGTYTYQVNNGVCEVSESTIIVQVPEIPVITNVTVVDFKENNNISIEVDGEGHFEYSVDGSDYQDDAYFEQLAPGSYNVYVRNKAGCDVAISTVLILDYPRFFTPNNDGYNDTWNIQGAADESYSLTIFDEFGKPLKIMSNGSKGWDGTYENTNMPSTDYWFRYTSETGITKTGHFTLKR